MMERVTTVARKRQWLLSFTKRRAFNVFFWVVFSGTRHTWCKRPYLVLRLLASNPDRGYQERSGHVLPLASSRSQEVFPTCRT